MPYVCKECDREFVNAGSLGNHMRHNHKEKKTVGDVSCPECGRRFKNKHAAQVHASRVHQKVELKKAEPAAVKFCPCCGINLQIFLQALRALEGLS
jgi:DNA-directed RNA polymerase subunit RPC12/RpoP